MENPGTLREKNGRVIELRNELDCEEVATTERWVWHIQLHGIYAETRFKMNPSPISWIPPESATDTLLFSV